MSQPKQSSIPEGKTLQNPQSKLNDQKKSFEKQMLPKEFDQNISNASNEQKKQQNNDFECPFKFVVKQKFQQKLKDDSTNEFFTIVINEIIEERVKRNFVADNQEVNTLLQNSVNLASEKKQQTKKTKNGLFELQRLRAQDEEVKRKIKQLMKRRPKAKSLITYELDPNRDKGFLLGRKMNEIKQQRQRKYLSSKKETQQLKITLIEKQAAGINRIENYSIHLSKKGEYHRIRKESQDFQLPKINFRKNSKNETDTFRGSKNGCFYDFLSHSKVINQKQLTSDEKIDNLFVGKHQNIVLSARSSCNQKSKNKRRDLLREIEILRKSQKITEKYQIKKMVFDILADLIWSSVKIVESKKQFFHNAPPKPVYQMIRTYKDQNEKSVSLNGSKAQRGKINIYMKESEKNKDTTNNEEKRDYQTKSNAQSSPRISRISQCFEISLGNKSSNLQNDIEQNSNSKDETDQKSSATQILDEQEQEKKSSTQNEQEIYEDSLEFPETQHQDVSNFQTNQ